MIYQGLSKQLLLAHSNGLTFIPGCLIVGLSQVVPLVLHGVVQVPFHFVLEGVQAYRAVGHEAERAGSKGARVGVNEHLDVDREPGANELFDVE